MERLLPTYPLWIVDPMFSIWSPHDRLNDGDTQFWTTKTKKVYGFVRYNQKTYCFLGARHGIDRLEQTAVSVSTFSTDYAFTCRDFDLKVSFVSPLPPDNLEVLSCPVCYTEYEIMPKGELAADFSIAIALDEGFCYDTEPDNVLGGVIPKDGYEAAFFSKYRNMPMSHSRDKITPDWGYTYVTGEEAWFISTAGLTRYLDDGVTEYIRRSDERHYIMGVHRAKKGYFMTAFDDLVSIFYFGEWLKGYFFKDGKTVLDALDFSRDRHDTIAQELAAFDRKFKADCAAVGKDYYLLACAAFRQSIGAHKLVENKKGEILFLSKECDSNGCIGTADVSYPSIPLYLLYNPELVKGMLRGIFDFARMDVWTYDFAPHDIGTYPYCLGQIYGVSEVDDKYACHHNAVFSDATIVHPMLYMRPAASNVYWEKFQMPVEECGNMIIMTAAAIVASGDDRIAVDHFDLLETWVKYLEKFGLKPDNQLCTDDFAGHLANNVNLAIKAIVGIESFGLICERLGKQDRADRAYACAKEYSEKLREMTGDGVMPLAYGSEGTYSLKYNILFDRLFGFDLFDAALCEREVDYYITKTETYGVPLDTREKYTKTDWILWTTALTDDQTKVEKLCAPIVKYLKETKTRVPFSDWMWAHDGNFVHFMNRSVQGGILVPLLKKSGIMNVKKR